MTRMLGIECTAHTFGIGWTDGEEIVHRNDTFMPPVGQGYLPRELGDHHAAVAPRLYNEIGREYDAVCFSKGPGIGQALQTGAVLARYISLKKKVPVYAVNHCAAHLEIGCKCTGITNPLFVYVSGGNTQVIDRIAGKKIQYRVLGETLDMGLGNAFDTFSRGIGLRHGGELEQMAMKSENYIGMPYSVKGMNFTFSGLLTAAEKEIKEGKNIKEDIAYTFMHTSFAMVTESVERALCLTHKNGIIVVGGVAKNRMFKKMLEEVCNDHGIPFASPPDEYNGDNGGMIAYTGWMNAKMRPGDKLKMKDVTPEPDWRIDEI